MAGRVAAGKWLLRIWCQFTVSSISEHSYAQWRTLTTFFCRFKSWPCNCTTVGSSAAAGLLSGGLASARNRRNRNGDSVAGWHQISVRECLCVWLRVWALLFSEVIMGSNSTLTWELEIVWSPQSCLTPGVSFLLISVGRPRGWSETCSLSGIYPFHTVASRGILTVKRREDR